jgi:general secretion pathway protein K
MGQVTPGSGGRPRAEHGLALVSVLWALVILSLLAASLIASLGFSYRLAHNRGERARAEALAEASIARAVLAMLDRRPDKAWRIDGTVTRFTYAGAALRVAIQDELGKIDLNAADGPLLKGLFRSAGLDAETAEIMADRVQDWRDSTGLHRVNGASDEDYRAAGYSYGPRHGPFQTINELKLVLGMTPALFDRITPAITVYSGRPSLDPATAPAAALRALAAMDGIAASGTVRTTDVSTGAASPATPGLLDLGLPLGGRAFTIHTEIDTPDGKVVREAVIRLTDDPAHAYWVLAWR